MDIDNFEWWYSEGEAPDEEWDEPASRDVSSDEDETGNDAAVEPDAASDAADIPALWDVVLSAGQKALEDTPNLLPVLKKAGVVHAGLGPSRGR